MMIEREYCGNNELAFEKMITKRLRKKNKRLWLLGMAATVFLGLAVIGKIWWSHEEAQAHIYPAYEKVDIESLLHKGEIHKNEVHKDVAFMEGGLQSGDYQLLYEQTGLGKSGVDYLFLIGQERRLLELQDNYFAAVTVDCQSNTLVTREERIAQVFPETTSNQETPRTRVYIPYVEAGDILISFNCHVFGWRNGHVGLVVDAEKRLTLEASELGTQSKVVSMNHWERYPSFVVLRLKGTTKESRADIAEFAKEYLVNIPYSLQAGMLDRISRRLKQEWIPERLDANAGIVQQDEIRIEEWEELQENEPKLGQQFEQRTMGSGSLPEGTHCAHLVWYAYKQFGYNVDSDGGFITTPRDLYNSDLWEVIQVYGMEY